MTSPAQVPPTSTSTEPHGAVPEPVRLGIRARLVLVSVAVVTMGLVFGQWWIARTLARDLGSLSGGGGMDAARAAADEATRRILVMGGAVGLAVSVGMAGLAAELMARPVRALTATARAMVGDLTVRTRRRHGGDVGALAAALDGLADNLAASLGSLARERDRLGAILEAMAEGVLVTDREGAIALANRALREMFLVGRDVVGQRPIEAVRNAELHEVIAETARTGVAVSRELAVGGVRPRRVMVRATSVEPPGVGVVAVLSDVTELRRLETVRRDFVANVSHELRTPVAAIRAATETLLGGALSSTDVAREFVSIVDRHAERLHRLVEDLLELSRLEARELSLTVGPLDVGEAVTRAVELFALAAQSRRVHLVADVPGERTPVEADAVALEHVLTNLVDNAIKYSPEGATVTVRVRCRADEAGGGVRLSVEDNGPGIDSRHLPRLFERFYRADASRSRALGGTGLGLAIVKHLAEAMGAVVSVESTVGRGSAFHVDLRKASVLQ